MEHLQPTLVRTYTRVLLFNYHFKASTRSYDASRSLTPNPNEVLNKRDGKFVDHRIIDRSFTDLGYIGYGEGIDLE